MELTNLTAISPIDGRYRGKTQPLADYFSEYALIRYRVRVEIEYFIALCQLPLPQLENVPHDIFHQLRDIYLNFTEADALRVKEIEATTNHDVKAVESFIKEHLKELEKLSTSNNVSEAITTSNFINFGLTSQDINNTSVPLSLKEALDEVFIPALEQLIEQLNDLAEA